MNTCLLCELPALDKGELCEAHTNALATPDPLCHECGEPLSAEDIEAGETICLECAGLELEAGIEQAGPLLAVVRVRLAR